MKVFIRDRVSSLYFSGHGKWVQQTTDAHDFQTSSAALEAIFFCGRNDVEVVLHVIGAETQEIVARQQPEGQLL